MLSGSITRSDNRGCRMSCSNPCMVAELPAQRYKVTSFYEFHAQN